MVQRHLRPSDGNSAPQHNCTASCRCSQPATTHSQPAVIVVQHSTDNLQTNLSRLGRVQAAELIPSGSNGKGIRQPLQVPTCHQGTGIQQPLQVPTCHQDPTSTQHLPVQQTHIQTMTVGSHGPLPPALLLRCKQTQGKITVQGTVQGELATCTTGRLCVVKDPPLLHKTTLQHCLQHDHHAIDCSKRRHARDAPSNDTQTRPQV